MSAQKKAKLTIVITTILGFIFLMVLVVQFIKINNLKILEANLLKEQTQYRTEISQYTTEINDIINREKQLSQYAHKYLMTKPGETLYKG